MIIDKATEQAEEFFFLSFSLVLSEIAKNSPHKNETAKIAPLPRENATAGSPPTAPTAD